MNKIDLKSVLEISALGTPVSRIVRTLSERGSLSAAQLARLTGLAKSTVSTTLSDLRQSGLVVEGTGSESGRTAGAGRPAIMLTLNPLAGTVAGVLIGLEQIRVAVADVSHTIIAERVQPMGDDYSPADAAEIVRRLIAEIYTEHCLPDAGLLGVGVAVAGPINPIDGRVQRASVVPTWEGTDVRELLGNVLHRPVFVDNESNCAALAEMTWGVAQGEDDFVLFKVDLGIGGAIVHGGRLITGIAGGGGEFGHMTLDPNGPLCRCGNRGCLELYASFQPSVACASRRYGRRMSMDEVVQLALDGDVGCRRLIEDTATAAGHGLGIVGTIINPPLIVVAGRVALAGDLLLEPLRRSYEKHTLVKADDVSPEARTRLVIGRLSDNDSVLGAVGLVLRHFGRAQD